MKQKKIHLCQDNSLELLALDNGGHSVPFPHHVFDSVGGWRQSQVKPHQVVKLRVSIDKSDYEHLSLPCPKMCPTKYSAMADSGCQITLLRLKVFNHFGLKKSCLVPVKGDLNAINGEGIDILGAVFLRIEGEMSAMALS